MIRPEADRDLVVADGEPGGATENDAAVALGRLDVARRLIGDAQMHPDNRHDIDQWRQRDKAQLLLQLGLAPFFGVQAQRQHAAALSDAD